MLHGAVWLGVVSAGNVMSPAVMVTAEIPSESKLADGGSTVIPQKSIADKVQCPDGNTSFEGGGPCDG